MSYKSLLLNLSYTFVHNFLGIIQAAVLAMDDTVLDIDQIENLVKFCPTNEEMELLKVYSESIIYLSFVICIIRSCYHYSLVTDTSSL